MVKDVEEFGAETQAYLFREMKLALQRNIRLRGSETAKNITPEIALLPFRWRRKRRAVEDFAAGVLRAMEHERHAWDYIRTGIESDAGSKDDSGDHVDRGS